MTKEIIKSTDNKKYKLLQQLESKKHRDKTGMFVVEGENLVKEAVESGNCNTVFVREDSIEKYAPWLDEYTVFSNSLFNKLSTTETSQGIIGIAEKPNWNLDDFAEKIGQDKNLVIFNKLQDPGNIGTIIRTAEAAGYGGILVEKGTGDVYGPKVVRAAAGSLLRLPIYFVDTEDEVVSICRKLSKKIVVTALSAKKTFYEIDWSQNIALVLGNEGNGVSEYYMKNFDENVIIPMEGKIESLNVAVAAGILMYQSLKRG